MLDLGVVMNSDLKIWTWNGSIGFQKKTNDTYDSNKFEEIIVKKVKWII